jgi:hypothetical protein
MDRVVDEYTVDRELIKEYSSYNPPRGVKYISIVIGVNKSNKNVMINKVVKRIVVLLEVNCLIYPIVRLLR